MTEKLMTFLQGVAASLQDFGTGAYLLVALLVFAETVVVIGQFIPGSVFLVFVGFLCYMQVFDLGGMLASVFISHYLGEALNYTLGRTKGRALFREESRFFRPALLEMTEKRFHAGGGRLLIAGQFLGMLRPIISLAAGITHYSPLRFFFFIAIGGFLWSSLPLVLGFFFGASWQQAVRYLEGFSTLLLVGIPTFLLSGWLIRQLIDNAGTAGRLLEAFARRVHRSPRYSRLALRHPRLFDFFERRLSLSRPWGLRATMGWAVSLCCLVVFVVILVQLRLGDRWRDVDLSVINFLAQIRAAAPDRAFEFLARLGDGPVVALVAVLAGLFCLHARQMKSLLVIVGSILASFLLSPLIRISYTTARPEAIRDLIAQGGYFFPGVHFAVCVAMFGAVYYWLWNHPGRARLRALLAFVVAAMVALVGFSRLYLGIHFPSDIAAGFFLGSAVVVALVTLAANAGSLIDIPRRADLAALVVLAAQFGGAAVLDRVGTRQPLPPQTTVTLTPPPPLVSGHPFARRALAAVPRAAYTVLDRPNLPINLIVIPEAAPGTPADEPAAVPAPLARRLRETGWQPVAPYAFFTRGIATPVFPAFVRGVPARATYELRSADGGTTRSILRLWSVRLPDADAPRPVWIGSVVGEVRRTRAFGLPGYYFDPDVDLALETFARSTAAPLPWRFVPGFRERGLYQWQQLFFTHGHALLITPPAE